MGLALLTLAGCGSLSLPKNFSWPWDSDHKAPIRMTDMWSFTVLQQPGQPGVRGYGGRLMFYDADDKPMKVDGTLTVYAFDARSNNPSQAVPERKFVFLPRDLPRHYSESKLGHSYSFWLPWDEVGGPERQIVLATRFESKNGEVLLASPSRQILPGARPNANKESTPGVAGISPAAPTGVRLASHQENLPDRLPNCGVVSATIDLPPSFVRQSLWSGNSSASENSPAPVRNDSSAAPAASPSPAAPSGGVSKEQAAPAKPAASGTDPNPPAEPAARCALPRFPARREVTAGPGTDLVRRQPYLGQWPSALPPTPRWDRWREVADNPPAAAAEPPAASAPAGQNTRN
jgi:hypothetical protein